jgi:hypothetical protein
MATLLTANWTIAAGILILILAIVGGHAVHHARRADPAAAAAWAAWKAGDLDAARSLGRKLAAEPATSDEGHHILALVAGVEGGYAEAIAHRAEISRSYSRLSELDEPVLWSHVHAGDLGGALVFAEQRNLGNVAATRLRLAISNPLSVQLHGVTVVPFSKDALTPYMPGMEATLCGRRTVVRLDTGGTYIHVSASQAAEFGIEPIATETAFGALAMGKVGYGVAPELSIGQAVLRNVPVVVHYGTLPAEEIAQVFGVEFGPIIGTNVLERFLATVDGPGRRLVLSPRGDTDAHAQHLTMVAVQKGKVSTLPFARWLDHYMLVQGRIAGRLERFFVDSGLAAMTPGQGQANLLASRRKLAEWDATAPQGQAFPVVPGALCIGDACRDRPTAYPVEDKVWEAFGDWGGSRVDALISWGYLSHFVWTLDFDSHTYALGDPR